MKLSEALKLRSIVEQAAASLDDKTASEGASLFPHLKGDGSLVRAGTRINWNGTIKRAAVDLYDTAETTPDAAKVLWEDIEYRGGYRIIPDSISVGKAFYKGECGWWRDDLYESIYPGDNVWTPEFYPGGWKLLLTGGEADR